jgi:CRISPR-associated protein Cmx8
MSAVKKSQDAESITLSYDLFELPSAQHKAGLAGLLLACDSLREREIAPLPVIKEVTRTSVSIELTKDALHTLMYEIYDGVEVKKTKSKKAKKVVNTEHPEDEDKVKVFPRGAVLERLLRSGANSPWLKLWREMVVGTLRIKPPSQYVYKRDKSKQTVVDELWKGLKQSDSALDIQGTLSIGAESANAELVPFKNRADHVVLLHFWLFACVVYVPRFLVRETQSEGPVWKESLEMSSKRKGPFFVIAVPDVTDIKYFVDVMKEYIQRLSDGMFWYRPSQAIIDVPEEAAIDFLYRFMRRRIAQEEISDCVSAVQIFYVESIRSRSAKVLSEAAIKPNRRVLAEYDELQDRKLNVHYKSIRIRNSLAGNRWYHNTDSLFSHYPFEHFIWTKSTPSFPFFGNDVKRYFTRLGQELNLLKESNAMNETDPGVRDDLLARRIYRIIGEYVNYKTDARSRVKYKDLPCDADGHKIYPKEFREARARVTSDAFLAMRSRRAEDFVEYFTGTICSVPHFVQEPEYLDLTQALIQAPDTVKNLSMLALSAYSWLPDKEGQNHSAIETQDQGETQ